MAKIGVHSAYCHIGLQLYTPVFAILMAIFSRWTCVSQYQNVAIMDFISSKVDGDGGDSWRHKMHMAAVT